jgi:hypothetical protein
MPQSHLIWKKLCCHHDQQKNKLLKNAKHVSNILVLALPHINHWNLSSTQEKNWSEI